MPDISYPVADGVGRGYLAAPGVAAGSAGSAGPGPGPGPWPGVVVIHEAFGLNDDIRKKADQFAAHGYVALAPDLYDGRSWLRCVRGVFGQLRPDRARRSPRWTRRGTTWPPATIAPAGPASSASAWAGGSRCYARPVTGSRWPR
jgi:dienelactone hydrolase